MLQVAYIRAHKEEVIKRLAVKNFDAKEIIEELLISKNIDAALVNEVVSILESCEIARFTQVNPKEGIQKSSLLNKTKKVIERLENY